MFDYHPEVDDHREALEAAAAGWRTPAARSSSRRWPTCSRAATRCPRRPQLVADDDDPLALLIYTSGSTGAPKGAMYPERLVAKCGAGRAGDWVDDRRRPSITLNFMPMSHVMGRGILYGTLGSGGTAYFAAKSDLSTLLEDLALVRPTELNFVPRIWDMLFRRVPERGRPAVGRRRRPQRRRGRGAGRAARRTCSAAGSSRR